MSYAAPIKILAQFQQELVGDWENRDFGKDEKRNPVGGPKNPLSYNIMPLPDESDKDGYILKNFKYHERLHFNDADDTNTLAIAASAPNRGGQVNQVARALFYEQQVRFAEGPAKNQVVHVENGAWLSLPRFVQEAGPFPANFPGNRVSDALQQPSEIFVTKQISVPHGNSILALGSYDTLPTKKGAGPLDGNPLLPGSPVIPDGESPYPRLAIPEPIEAGTPVPATLVSNLNAGKRYTTKLDSNSNFQNPHPIFTQYPNKPLQEAVAIIEPDSYMHWRVTTRRSPYGRGDVLDIPFEERVSDVIEYSSEYWLLFKDSGKGSGKGSGKYPAKYLAYTQTILMVLTIKGFKYNFPHVTCNTVTFC